MSDTDAPKVLACPFCGRLLSSDANFCCGEVNHGEWLTEEEYAEKWHIQKTVPSGSEPSQR